MEALIMLCILVVMFLVVCYIFIILSNRSTSKHIAETSIQYIDKMSGSEFEEWVTAWHQYVLKYKAHNLQDSQDFGIDVIVETPTAKIAIQCKRYKGTVGVDAVREAFAGMFYYDCDGAEVWTNSTFTRQAWELANKIGVKMVDRKELKRIIEEKGQSVIL